uniref:PDZ domain-containing protein n=1 Tax=Panagrolaimus davidi TaxID=227884 RepID=A0A914PIX3_9BILA
MRFFNELNDRKPDDSPKKAAVEDPIKREFDDIVIPSNEKCPPDMTARIAPQSAESLPPVPNATERLELDIDLDEDLNLGLNINEKLFIDGFKKMGPQELKFTIGDQITSVNGRNVSVLAFILFSV